jgi:uncharacterized small protein (DUF1192 family)
MNGIGSGLVGANYSGQIEKQQYHEQMMSRTIGQNIDQRILNLRAEIERLEGVRAQLENGASLLDVRIEDLRQAMNY